MSTSNQWGPLVSISIIDAFLNLSGVISYDYEAREHAKTHVDHLCQAVEEFTVLPRSGHPDTETTGPKVELWPDAVTTPRSGVEANRQPLQVLNENPDMCMSLRKVHEPESTEIVVLEIKASRWGPSATRHWLPKLAPHARLLEIAVQDPLWFKVLRSTDKNVDHTAEYLLHSIHQEIIDTEGPILFITHGECVSLLRQVLSASKHDETLGHARRGLLFNKTVGIVDSGWVEGDGSALSSNELRKIIQQVRFWTPEQLTWSQLQYRQSRRLRYARLGIESFTLLYISVRVWSSFDVSTSTEVIEVPSFFPLKNSSSATPNEMLCLSLLWSCWALTLHRIHSRDRYQDHCLFASLIFSSAVGFLGAIDPWDFFSRYLFCGVIIGLLISALGHRWVRWA